MISPLLAALMFFGGGSHAPEPPPVAVTALVRVNITMTDVAIGALQTIPSILGKGLRSEGVEIAKRDHCLPGEYEVQLAIRVLARDHAATAVVAWQVFEAQAHGEEWTRRFSRPPAGFHLIRVYSSGEVVLQGPKETIMAEVASYIKRETPGLGRALVAHRERQEEDRAKRQQEGAYRSARWCCRGTA